MSPNQAADFLAEMGAMARVADLANRASLRVLARLGFTEVGCEAESVGGAACTDIVLEPIRPPWKLTLASMH